MKSTKDNACVLVLMCKRPRPGVSKQRIAATAGIDAAHRLSLLLVDCALEDLNAWQGPRVIAVAEADDLPWAESLPVDAKIMHQAPGNLGERIMSIDTTIDDDEAPRLYIGIDAPSLTPDYLASAGTSLRSHDVVLGAAEDGGVVVMGCNGPWPNLHNLPWSTPLLGSALTALCLDEKRTVATLATHVDLDHEAQFKQIRDQLEPDKRQSREALLSWLNEYITQTQLDSSRAG
ncbi:MAG: DUF2064 domain-containing protein [Woeseiaceae bacterium]